MVNWIERLGKINQWIWVRIKKGIEKLKQSDIYCPYSGLHHRLIFLSEYFSFHKTLSKVTFSIKMVKCHVFCHFSTKKIPWVPNLLGGDVVLYSGIWHNIEILVNLESSVIIILIYCYLKLFYIIFGRSSCRIKTFHQPFDDHQCSDWQIQPSDIWKAVCPLNGCV